MNSESDISHTKPIHAIVQGCQSELKARSKELSKTATALTPLSREANFKDVKRAFAVLEKVRKKLPTNMSDYGAVEAVLTTVQDHLEERERLMKERLGAELRDACERRGLEMRVLRRDDLVELRITPLAVVIDRKKGIATIQFAKESILQTPAEPEAILDGYDDALKSLNKKFDPTAFHEDCYRAWQACRAATAAKGDRVEIVDFLPYLALQRQGLSFKRDPKQKAFRDYTRAQFAWDILRLREQRMLIQKQRRLNLGVATGTSASKKSRVIFFEDPQGEGEFKLTIFFTKEENR